MATLEPKVQADPPRVTAGAPRTSRTYGALLVGTFVIAVSGLVYELIAGTLSSYLLGDSVYQFSIVIGLFMTAMGLGSYLSRCIGDRLEQAFVGTQIALGLIGGLAALALFFAFVYLDSYEAFLFLICIAIGTLVGLEIPLIIRILKRERTLEINISNILTVDYIGALVAALLFPLVLVPQLGLIATGFLFGTLNLLVAGLAAWLFRHVIDRRLLWVTAAATALLITGLLSSQWLVRTIETRLYHDEIIYAETTPYQRIVATHQNGHLRLFLNGALQFDSVDEHRYHEALVHPAMSLAGRPDAVLVLGGGDGMAVREVLRHDDVESVTLVDLDPAMTRLFREHPRLNQLNEGALDDPRVEVINEDAFEFLKTDDATYNVILIDLPDPKNPSLSKLYSLAFYTAAARRLARDGVLVTQATSPVYAREAFWSIFSTLDATNDPYRAGETLSAVPYHAYVPSFGDWGFVAASPARLDWSRIQLPADLRFLTDDTLPSLTNFPPDIDRLPVEINTLQDHPLLRYYQQGWSRWFP
ncbi:MAG: polyamine aminopropyltransferase [Pseudomonadota bacterium]